MASRRRLRRTAEAARANEQASTQRAHLLGIPHEIRQKILREAITEGVEVLRPSASRQSIYGLRKEEIDVSFKTAYSRLASFVATSKDLRDECYEYLSQEITLEESNSNTLLFQHRTAYWSKSLLAKIQKLRVGVSFGMKLKADQMWGQYLQFFVALMPSLIHLELYTEFYHHDEPFPKKLSGEPLGDVRRLDQERRCKLFFLSYLTKRHPSLNRIILPALSGPTFEEGQEKIRHWLIAERSFDVTPGDRNFIWEVMTKKTSEDADAIVQEDEVLNATLIRRQHYTALCWTTDSEFVIEPQLGQRKDEIHSSEIECSDQKYYDFVDSRAYRTRGHRALKDWKEHSADELLKICAQFPRREKHVSFAVAVARKSQDFWRETKYTNFADAIASESGRLNLEVRSAEARARRAFQIRSRGWNIAAHQEEHAALVKKVNYMVIDRMYEIENELAEEEEKWE